MSSEPKKVSSVFGKQRKRIKNDLTKKEIIGFLIRLRDELEWTPFSGQ